MRQGVRLGVDVGTVRVGVSVSDPSGMLATPVETVPRAGADPVRRVAGLAAERDAVEIIVGLPIALSGRTTASTDDASAFARELAACTRIPVRLVDERLSTVSAASGMRAAGRSTKRARPVIDQAAAAIILQQALDTERASGTLPGTVVTPSEGNPT